MKSYQDASANMGLHPQSLMDVSTGVDGRTSLARDLRVCVRRGELRPLQQPG